MSFPEKLDKLTGDRKRKQALWIALLLTFVLSLLLLSWSNDHKWVTALTDNGKIARPETREDMYKMLRDGRTRRLGKMAELGVYKGANALIIWNLLLPEELILIDTWEETLDVRFKAENKKITEEKFDKELSSGKVKTIRGDGKTIIAGYPNESFDLIYIDTSHDYYATMKELQNVARVIKPNGRICGHDFVHPLKKNYGVIPAVIEFCLDNNWRLTHVTKEEYRSFCLTKSAS